MIEKYKDHAYFDEENDAYLLEVLQHFPPRMPSGYRLPPILDCLLDEQKFEILFQLADDILSVIAFLTALCIEEGEDTIWDFFIKLWPQICEEARLYSLFSVVKFKCPAEKRKMQFMTDSTVPRRILEDILGDDKKWLYLLKMTPNMTKKD